MDKSEPKPAIQKATKKKTKPLSKGQRIYRRRTLALQRRTEKDQTVTSRE